MRRELAAWWDVVPASRRNVRTDMLAAGVLAVSADPVATVAYWRATREHSPWTLAERAGVGLGRFRAVVAEVLADNP